MSDETCPRLRLHALWRVSTSARCEPERFHHRIWGESGKLLDKPAGALFIAVSFSVKSCSVCCVRHRGSASVQLPQPEISVTGPGKRLLGSKQTTGCRCTWTSLPECR